MTKLIIIPYTFTKLMMTEVLLVPCRHTRHQYDALDDDFDNIMR